MTSISAEPAPTATGYRDGVDEHRVQLWCLWCAPVFTLLLFGGMVIAGFIPPPTPGQSAQQVADLYATHTDLKRLGFILIIIGGGLTAPFVVAIDHQLRRIPGARSMALFQVIAGSIGTVAILFPTLVFMAVAFRPERSPELTQMLHDLAFIPFIGNFVPFLSQCVAIAMAIFLQRPGEEILPRWVGYFNLWTGFLSIPGITLIYFHGGAFAWNGAVNFWVVAVVFGSWFNVMFVVLRSALLAQRATSRAEVSAVHR